MYGLLREMSSAPISYNADETAPEVEVGGSNYTVGVRSKPPGEMYYRRFKQAIQNQVALSIVVDKIFPHRFIKVSLKLDIYKF